MITSGLVVQNKGYGTYQSLRTRDRTNVRPYVYGFDSVPVSKSDYHNPYLKTPPTVNYQKIFGRGVTPSEKDYFMTHGKTMIQKAADGVIAGRARRGKSKKSSGAVNDSFKNMVSYDEWRELMLKDPTTPMVGVDEHGARSERARILNRYLQEAAERRRYELFQERVLPPAISSTDNKTEDVVSSEKLGSAASPADLERMAVEVSPVHSDAMNLGTVQDEEKDLSNLFDQRLAQVNNAPSVSPTTSSVSQKTSSDSQAMQIDSPTTPPFVSPTTPPVSPPFIDLEAINAVRSNLRRPVTAPVRAPAPANFHEQLMNAIKANGGRPRRNKSV